MSEWYWRLGTVIEDDQCLYWLYLDAVPSPGLLFVWRAAVAGCADTYLGNNCHPGVIESRWSDCQPRTALTALWFTLFVVFGLTSGCRQRAHCARSVRSECALCANNIASFRESWRSGGARRHTHFFLLVLRGLLLYIRRSWAARDSHSSYVLQGTRPTSSSSSSSSPVLSQGNNSARTGTDPRLSPRDWILTERHWGEQQETLHTFICQQGLCTLTFHLYFIRIWSGIRL